MPPTNNDLSKKITRASTALSKLEKKLDPKKATDKQKLAILKAKQKLAIKKQEMLAANIVESGKQYEAVTLALDDASDQMEKTIEDLSKLANTLKTIGAAIDLLMKFKPA
jgi:predicted  nucleic acid-binding Zn-ribbon protein